jgi:Ca2+-binding RTX toxin-like protein
MPSATVRIKQNSKFTFDDVIAFLDWSLTEATPQNPSPSGLTLSGVYQGARVVAEVDGNNLAYAMVGGFPALVGGTITKVSIKIQGVEVGVINTNVNAKTLSGIVQKDASGADPAAIEKYLMGFNWNFHDSNAAGVLPSSINGVPVNLRGNDKIRLNGGNDKVSAGSGNDRVDGDDGNDVLNGDAGNDALLGGKGKDTLNGGTGKDKLIGGLGADILTGGSQADWFIFNSVKESTTSTKGMDTIRDFSQAQDDVINLKGIDINSKAAGRQKFDFIRDDAFSKKAGELRFEQKKGNTYVQGDVNGDGKADFMIKLIGTFDLERGDFFL